MAKKPDSETLTPEACREIEILQDLQLAEAADRVEDTSLDEDGAIPEQVPGPQAVEITDPARETVGPARRVEAQIEGAGVNP